MTSKNILMTKSPNSTQSTPNMRLLIYNAAPDGTA